MRTYPLLSDETVVTVFNILHSIWLHESAILSPCGHLHMIWIAITWWVKNDVKQNSLGWTRPNYGHLSERKELEYSLTQRLLMKVCFIGQIRGWYHLNQIFMVSKTGSKILIMLTVISLWVFVQRNPLKANTLALGYQRV